MTDNAAYSWTAAVNETVDATLNRTVSSGKSLRFWSWISLSIEDVNGLEPRSLLMHKFNARSPFHAMLNASLDTRFLVYWLIAIAAQY